MNGELVQQRTGRLAVVRGRPLSEQLAVAAVRELGAQREALDLAPRRTVRRVTLTLDIRPDGTVGGVTTAIDSSERSTPMVAMRSIPGLMRELEARAQLAAQTADEVPASMVRPDVREAAETWAAAVALSLGMKSIPRIKWLSLSADVRGRVDPDQPNTIMVKPQEVPAVVETVAHEVRHLWQLQGDAFRWTGKGLQTHDEREADAHEYGQSVKAAFLEGRPLSVQVGATAPRPVAVAAQRYQPAPERKAAYRECPQCWEDVPVPGSHRCPVAAAYTGRASW